MIYNNMEFHNVAELEKNEGLPGLRLQRFPAAVRNGLGHNDHERGRFYSQRSVGCEIRFVTEAKFFRVSLSTYEGDGEVFIFKGCFLHSRHRLKAGIITTLHIEEPTGLKGVRREAFDGNAFSPDVWRILFGHDCHYIFHHIDTFGHDTRPPVKGETPALKWLAYGSSITHGGEAQLYTNTYVQQAAKRLKVDVLCKGIAGSCFCDRSIAHYIAESGEWDFATFEIGVNMYGRFTPEEFKERAKYLVNTVVQKNPEKPVILINIYPNGALYSANQNNAGYRNAMEYNRIVAKLPEELGYKNVHFIDGKEILTEFSGLSADLLHPSDDGHIIMGQNLAEKLKPILGL